MTVHKVDITPSFNAVVRIVLGVLENNDFHSEPSTRAKKHLFDMARILDTINKEQMLTKEQYEIVMENREDFEEHN